MKKKLFIAVLFIAFVNGNAQNIPFKLLKSAIFTDEYKNSNIVLAEDDGKNGLLMVRSFEGGAFSSGKGYYFEQYDSNLKLIKSQEYDMQHPNYQKYNLVLGLFNDGNAVHIVELYYDINDKSYICMAHSIKNNDFKAEKKQLFRLSLQEISQSGYFNLKDLFFSTAYKSWMTNNYGGQFFYPWTGPDFFSGKTSSGSDNSSCGVTMAVNEDKTAFGIALDLSGKKTEALKLYLFDNNFNKKTEQYFRPGLKDKKFHYQTVTVAKNGNSIYLLGKAYDEKSKKKEEGGKYEYQLTQFYQEGQRTQNFDTGEHYVTSLKTLFLEDKLACIGFYSDKRDNQYKGVGYFEIDPASLEVKKSKFNPFPQKFMIDKYGEDKEKELKYLTFRKFLITKNRDIIFNAEEVYVRSTNSYAGAMGAGGMGGGSYTSYNFDDIVSAKIDANGDLIWARNINKSQSINDDEDSYISYTSTVKDESTYFFINAADKLRKISNDRIEFKDVRKNKSNLNMIRISEKGDFDYQEILDDETNEVPFMVSKGVVSNGFVYFLGRKGKKKQLLKITL